MTAGAELDMVFKQLCDKLDPSKSHSNINEYFDIVISVFPGILTRERYVRGYGIVLKPFDGWTRGANPGWWSDGYNKIKHERNAHFEKANLKVALDIIAALSIILFAYYKVEYGQSLTFGITDMPKLIVPYDRAKPDKEGYNYTLDMDA